jgi:retron-type reverse transcriptase
VSLWSWVKRVFSSGVQRDVSMLGADGEVDVEVVSENVDLSGGPLRPNGVRRALRDRRLLPKKPVRWPLKRKRLMSAEEAQRLFSETQRTQNRNIRDLLPDEAQLTRQGLPLWLTETDLAQSLGLSLRELHYFGSHRQRDRVLHYVRFAIPKRSGGERVIMAPKRRLKAIQRTLHRELTSKFSLDDAAHGFRRGRSIRSAAEPHVGKQVLLKMDLEDFFPSVSFRRVRGFLVAMGYGYPVATTLAVLMTEAERQVVSIEGALSYVPVGERVCVQGAPTSPGLTNAIARKLDRRLSGLAKTHGFAYTRYADDLTFSGDDVSVVEGLRKSATAIIASEGFRVNRKKTRVMRRSARQSVVGVTVNDTLGLSRRERRRLRALIHQHGTDPSKAALIAGKLSYLAMLNREQFLALNAKWRALTGSVDR